MTQGFTLPCDVGIINKLDNNPLSIDSVDHIDVQILTASILHIVSGNKPEITISRESQNSPWFGHILREAVERQDIALIYKLDFRALDHLRAIGIKTLPDLLGADLQQLPKIPYAQLKTLEKKQLQARALIDRTYA